MSTVRTVFRFLSIKTTLKLNSRCLCSSQTNFKEHYRHQRENNGYFLGGILVTAGVIGYASYKDRLSAATPTSLSGRREKFNFIADVVAVAAPAVVYIEIKDTRRIHKMTGEALTLSNGSGFIVNSDGLILTNAHVVVHKPHAAILVKLMDGTTHEAFIENTDHVSDLATLRIPVRNLPTVKLGSSENLRPGEWVVAMGSPLALSNTVTAGVVSSTHRESQELGLHGKDMKYIQTDAPITFGNSGGPLVNLDGEAIGINSMKVVPGISFAIPIDYVKDFLKKASKSSPVSKRYLGITMLSLTPHMLLELKMRNPDMADVQHGILVWKVIVGSPAYNGGLQPGDIVTTINGTAVHSAGDIYSALESTSGKLTLGVTRGNASTNIIITPEQH